MRFYNNIHPYYCGIDLHARILYVCIVDQAGVVMVHQEIPADPAKLHQLLSPYIGSIVVGVECMHCWYWVSDFRYRDPGSRYTFVACIDKLRGSGYR